MKLLYESILGISWSVGAVSMMFALLLKLKWIPTWVALDTSPQGCVIFAGVLFLFVLTTVEISRARASEA